jgi:chemotaxis signal transduction protein
MPKYSESADRRVGLTLAGLSLPAASPGALEDRAEVLSVLKFEVGGELFAVGVDYTEGVVDCPRISPLPSPPDGIVGIASVRGRMTVVMDLSLGVSQKAERRRLILLKGDSQLGLLADRVEGVVALPPKSIRRQPARKQSLDSLPEGAQTGSWPSSRYFRVEGTPVPILDIEALTEL